MPVLLFAKSAWVRLPVIVLAVGFLAGRSLMMGFTGPVFAIQFCVLLDWNGMRRKLGTKLGVAGAWA